MTREGGAKVSTEAEICPHCGALHSPARLVTDKADTERTRGVFFATIALIFFIWLFARIMTSPTQQSAKDDAAWDAAMDYCIQRMTTEMPPSETVLMPRETLQKVVFGICMQGRGYELINEKQGCPALGYASCWRRKDK